MKRSLFHNLSANALQLVVNQFFGLIIFYILSTKLDKATFGQINLALAILLAIFNILSLGIDQMMVKKIAVGNDRQHLLSVYIGHVLLTGLLAYGLFFIVYFVFNTNGNIFYLLLMIGAGKLMIYFSTPFKQVASGLEQFRLLAQMSVISNLLKGTCLMVFAFLGMINLYTIIAVFIMGDMVELITCIWLFKKTTKTNLIIKWDRISYVQLLKESMPQTGVVFITSALARFDWIFIGFFLSAVKLAEYSFAYKIFEMSTLPLLAIAPLLIPRFSKMLKQGIMETANLKFEIRIELIIALLTGLILNICWTQIFDPLTGDKYGAVNVTTIFILTLCIPLLYFNNFLWTIYFVQGKLKMILRSFVIALVVNVGADLVLIPLYKNEGAAFAFLLSCIVQTVYYIRQNQIANLTRVWQPLVICTFCAVSSGFVVKYLFTNTWQALLVAIALYFLLLFLTSQIRFSDRESLKAVLTR